MTSRDCEGAELCTPHGRPITASLRARLVFEQSLGFWPLAIGRRQVASGQRLIAKNDP
jgi:hypothetical protein